MKEFIRLIISKLFRHGVYYVGSSDILPPPLSKEEEKTALNQEKQILHSYERF